MTAIEILAAWKAAAAAGGSQFYAEFERLTGFTEADVKRHFGDWNRLSHETAEKIAEDNGVTIREGGFQAYLATIKRTGRPPIAAIIDDEGADDDPNPRADKPWPASEDCTGCDGRIGPNGWHRFGCTLHGARASQLVVPVRVEE